MNNALPSGPPGALPPVHPFAVHTSVVFRARGVSKVYHMGEVDVHALRAVDLELYAGELLVLLGASGSGKSTLLNILGGLDVPTAGEVWYRDQELSAANEKELTRYRRDHVGFVFQFYNLIPSLTARENVALVTDIARAPMPAEEALEMVGLGERADHFPAQLSGGEQQRVAIARALIMEPSLILADEPTGSLDAATALHMLELLEEYQRSSACTLIVVSHDPKVLARASLRLELSATRLSPAVQTKVVE